MTNEQKEMIKGAGELLADVEKPMVIKQNPTEKTEKKTCNKRSRRFSCVTYISTDDLEKWLKNSLWIQHWAYAHHDSDVWTEDDEAQNNNHKAGSSKTAHTHVILYTYEGKSSSAIKKNFDRLAKTVNSDNPQNTQVQLCNDGGAQFRYLLHEDDIDKHQYEKHCRICDDTLYWERLSYTDGLNDTKSNSALAIINDILDGTAERIMCERYGRDWIINRRKYLESAHAITREEYNGQRVDFDKDMIKLLLDSSPFYQIDVEKFFDIIKYLEKQFKNDFGQTPSFNFYLGG